MRLQGGNLCHRYCTLFLSIASMPIGGGCLCGEGIGISSRMEYLKRRVARVSNRMEWSDEVFTNISRRMECLGG